MGRRARMRSKERNRRIILIAAAAVTIIALTVFALLVDASLRTPYADSIYQPVPTSLYQQITTVNDSTLSAVGSVPSVAAPTQISGTVLDLNGKPEILYIGAEYCPFCAVERWALIVALSHFGSFSGLQYMLSSSTDTNANTPTFTFWNATYTSQYVMFVPIEEFNRTNEATPWHPLTGTSASLYQQYGTGFPFVDFANMYLVNGVQSNIDLSANNGYNWTKIASFLANPSSTIAQQIDGSANKLIMVICKIDGGLPTSVCTQSYATLALAYTTVGNWSVPAPPLILTTDVPQTNPVRGSNRWTG